MKRPSTRALSQFLFSALLMVLVLLAVDIRATIGEMRDADLSWVALALAATVVSRFVMAYKWNFLMRARDIVVSHLEVVRIYYVSGFLGLLLPATLGGDVIRAIFLRAPDRAFPDIVGSIIVERLLGLAMLALVALAAGLALAGVVFQQTAPLSIVLGVPAALLAASLLAIGFSLTPVARRMVDGVASRLDRGARLSRLAGPLRKLYDSYGAYRHHPASVLSFCALTLLEILTLVVWNYCAARAVGMEAGILAFLLVVPVMTVLVRLPISIAGLGVVEASWVFFFGLLGVASEQALAAGILAHAISIVAFLPGGLLYVAVPRYRRRARDAADARGAVVPTAATTDARVDARVDAV